MAIINCPECEGAISDKAKFCVHCGCSIFVCEECGAVLTQECSFCPECGAPLKTGVEEVEEIVENETKDSFFDAPPVEEQKEVLPNITLLISEFRNSGGANGFMYKGVKIIRTVFTILSIVLSVGGLLLILLSAFSDLNPVNIPFDDLATLVLISFVLGDILGFVNNFLFRAVHFYTPMTMEKWILKNGFDAKLILKALLQNGTAGEISRTPKRLNTIEPEAHQLATAALHIVNGEKGKTITFNAISLSLFVITNVFSLMLILVYLIPLYSLLGNGFDAGILESFTSLFIFNPFFSIIICMIVIGIGDTIFTSVWNNKKRDREVKWLHENLPECFSFSSLQETGMKSL